MRKTLSVIVVLFALIGTYGLTKLDAHALTCMVNADPWFNEVITIDSDSVPEGIKLSVSYKPIGKIEVANTTNDPLYIVEEHPDPNIEFKGPSFDNPGTPKGFIPVAKLVNDKLYRWGHKPNGTVGWNEKLGTTHSLYLDDILDDEFGFGNQVRVDNRPKNVEVPSDYPINYQVFHKNQLITITGKVQYSLNEEYNPEAFKESQEECSESQKTWLYSMKPRYERLFLWFVNLF